MSDIREVLLRHVFPDLAEDLLVKLASAGNMKTYPEGTILCHEGRHEDTFYVVQEGEVVYTKKMGDDDHVLRHGGANDFFGEMALLDDRIGRSATVATSKPSTLLEIERPVFDELLKDSPVLVLAMAQMMVHRMRENDRLAIMELRAQKKEVERAYAALQKIDEQRTIFLDTLSHELRTPLTSVMGYMQLVRGGHLEGENLKMSLEKMGVGLDRMVSLINDLLFLQEKETLQPNFKKIDFKHILEGVIERSSNYAREQKVNLILNEDENLPELNAEADGLTRACWHLVDNAIKFSPDGGDVTVNARVEAGHVVVEVMDQGVGIDPQFMPNLFRRFERDEKYGKHLFGGVGLGMPIVKQIIEMHGGTIEVESKRGEGTKFTIHLPFDARRATQEINIDDAWVDVPE